MKPEGLLLIEDFVSDGEQHSLLEAVAGEPWRHDLKRRVQHYGYVYSYKARRIEPSMYLGPLPPWCRFVTDRMAMHGVMTHPDQLIVNEYLPGQGISRHVDCVPCFGPVVAALSLGWTVPMKFTDTRLAQTIDIRLPVGSLVVMAGDSRFHWSHEIAARSSDLLHGQRIARQRRVSLTFRTVLT